MAIRLFINIHSTKKQSRLTPQRWFKLSAKHVVPAGARWKKLGDKSRPNKGAKNEGPRRTLPALWAWVKRGAKVENGVRVGAWIDALVINGRSEWRVLRHRDNAECCPAPELPRRMPRCSRVVEAPRPYRRSRRRLVANWPIGNCHRVSIRGRTGAETNKSRNEFRDHFQTWR